MENVFPYTWNIMYTTAASKFHYRQVNSGVLCLAVNLLFSSQPTPAAVSSFWAHSAMTGLSCHPSQKVAFAVFSSEMLRIWTFSPFCRIISRIRRGFYWTTAVPTDCCPRETFLIPKCRWLSESEEFVGNLLCWLASIQALRAQQHRASVHCSASRYENFTCHTVEMVVSSIFVCCESTSNRFFSSDDFVYDSCAVWLGYIMFIIFGLLSVNHIYADVLHYYSEVWVFVLVDLAIECWQKWDQSKCLLWLDG